MYDYTITTDMIMTFNRIRTHTYMYMYNDAWLPQ